MEQKVYMISDAAKQVQVESHVLRYWEDELGLPIKRNKLGHRYYTSEDVNRLKRVKDMKEQGFQLKAIRRALQSEQQRKQKAVEEQVQIGQESQMGQQTQAGQGNGTVQQEQAELQGTQAQGLCVQMQALKTQTQESVQQETVSKQEVRVQEAQQELSREDKSYRLQILLKNMMIEAIREGNESFAEELKESILKELDYQFRAQEEREDEREKERLAREEEHYRQIDVMLREKADKKEKKEKRKKHSFF